MLEQRRRRRFPFAGAALIALFVFMLAPAAAHHGWAGYLDDDFEITGTVEETVSLAGAHAALKVEVDGQVWNVVLAPPARTERAGLKAGMIPVGEQVTAYGHRHRNPRTLEIKTERLRWKDRLFNVYPDRT